MQHDAEKEVCTLRIRSQYALKDEQMPGSTRRARNSQIPCTMPRTAAFHTSMPAPHSLYSLYYMAGAEGIERSLRQITGPDTPVKGIALCSKTLREKIDGSRLYRVRGGVAALLCGGGSLLPVANFL